MRRFRGGNSRAVNFSADKPGVLVLSSESAEEK